MVLVIYGPVLIGALSEPGTGVKLEDQLLCRHAPVCRSHPRAGERDATIRCGRVAESRKSVSKFHQWPTATTADNGGCQPAQIPSQQETRAEVCDDS